MKKIFLLLTAWAFHTIAYAQHTFSIYVKDAETNEALIGAIVRTPDASVSVSTDTLGKVLISGIPAGTYSVEIRHIGYQTQNLALNFPLKSSKSLTVLLKPETGALEEVVVSSTRSSRTIANIPTRIELIGGEELDEKANMRPGNIRMVLMESTGIQVQQTSATSANASLRIQGLDGRYTQLLKDGFPLYSGAASGLGLLQTPPLDLKRVEVIKGSASTLYGGGAIAGLVNLISKTPTADRELNFLLNGTSAGGLDISGFLGQRFQKTGLTVFASRNSSLPYAAGSTDFTAIPKFERYTFNPKFFWYLNKTELSFGLNSSIEDRIGGDLHYINNESLPDHTYFEKNKTQRFSTQLSLNHTINGNSKFTFKNSISRFNRIITTPGYRFEGTQISSFSEADFTYQRGGTEWVAGLNLWTDKFDEEKGSGVSLRDYNQLTGGVFIQNNTHVNSWIELEAGLRGDYVIDYGFALLPRLYGLFKIAPGLTSRLGGGLGYKAPTIFTEESERIHYRDVLPVSNNVNRLEKSYGVNWDLNYQIGLFNNQGSFSINQLFFYTYLNHPLTLVSYNNQFRFESLPGYINSRGIETNIKLTYQDFKWFMGYSLTDTRIHNEGIVSQNPLTAKHRLNNVLMYEQEDAWRIGAEAYYYSPQLLNDGDTGNPYWIFGFMVEKMWECFSLYINFENFSDTRQTRFGNIYTGPTSSPDFKDIYAPLDGFVVNGGLKLRL